MLQKCLLAWWGWETGFPLHFSSIQFSRSVMSDSL